jgi:RimJ/RimL family protein N-acetyltransferase
MFVDVNSHNFIVLNENSIAFGHIVLEIKNGSAEYHVVIGNKRFIGKGYGTLMNLKAVNLAFKRYKLGRIFLKVRPENLRAIKSYEKAGFKRIGRRKYKNSNMPELIIMEIRNKN